jgi:hypothetical protein
MKLLVCAIAGMSVLMAGSAAHAQSVEGGVKAGVTFSSLSVTGLPGFEAHRGAGAGGGGWISFGRERVRVQPEVLVTTRHFSFTSPIGDLDIAARSVDVPVLIVARLGSTDGRVRPIVFGGPYVAFLHRATQTLGSTTTDLDSMLKDAEAGVTFGAGLEIGAARGALVIDARVSIGLSNVSENAETSFKSRGGMVAVGYRF